MEINETHYPEWAEDEYSRGVETRKEMFSEARRALNPFEKGDHIFGITKGQFSLGELAEVCLRRAGKADVTVTQWGVSKADIKRFRWLRKRRRIDDCRWIIAESLKKRSPDIFELLLEYFGAESFRVARVHAKIVTITNDEWSIAIRGSQNMTANPRIEQWEVSEGDGLAEFVVEELVDPIFEQISPQETIESDHKTLREKYEEFGGAEVELSTMEKMKSIAERI